MKDIKKSQQVQNKREKEKQIVDLMIHLYCRKKHKTVEKHHGLPFVNFRLDIGITQN